MKELKDPIFRWLAIRMQGLDLTEAKLAVIEQVTFKGPPERFKEIYRIFEGYHLPLQYSDDYKLLVPESLIPTDGYHIPFGGLLAVEISAPGVQGKALVAAIDILPEGTELAVFVVPPDAWPALSPRWQLLRDYLNKRQCLKRKPGRPPHEENIRAREMIEQGRSPQEAQQVWMEERSKTGRNPLYNRNDSFKKVKKKPTKTAGHQHRQSQPSALEIPAADPKDMEPLVCQILTGTREEQKQIAIEISPTMLIALGEHHQQDYKKAHKIIRELRSEIFE